MRGSPLVRALLAFLLLLSVGYPLRVLTRAEVGGATAAAALPAQEAKTVRLQLTFTSVCTNVKVQHLGREVLSQSAPPLESEHVLQLVFPPEGVDLHIVAELTADAPLTALRVKLTDPAGDEHEKTVWGKGGIDEVVTFP